MTGESSMQILMCSDHGDERIDLSKIGPSTSDPCDCGCGWWSLLCQVCGVAIGEATSDGEIDLEASMNFDMNTPQR